MNPYPLSLNPVFPGPDPVLGLIFILTLVFLVAGYCYARSVLRLGLARALGFGVGATLAAFLVTFFANDGARHLPWNPPDAYRAPYWDQDFRLGAAFAAVFLSLLLVAQLWQRWLGPRVATEETAGVAPVRLTPGQVVLALLLAVCAGWGWGWSSVGVFLLSVLALLAHQLYHKTLAEPPAPPQAAPTAAREREKVLAMLDAGKLTPAESAELLNALAASAPAPAVSPARGPAATRPRRLLLTGAALVLAGFFLPWFKVDPRQRLEELLGQSGLAPELPQLETINSTSGSFELHGGDIGRGLGWLVLLLALGTVALPYVWPDLAEHDWRRIAFLALGTGGLVLLYLLSQNLHFAGLGIVIVVLGYAAEAAGVAQTGRRAA